MIPLLLGARVPSAEWARSGDSEIESPAWTAWIVSGSRNQGSQNLLPDEGPYDYTRVYFFKNS